MLGVGKEPALPSRRDIEFWASSVEGAWRKFRIAGIDRLLFSEGLLASLAGSSMGPCAARVPMGRRFNAKRVGIEVGPERERLDSDELDE